jgi:hypothetical protein
VQGSRRNMESLLGEQEAKRAKDIVKETILIMI